MRGLGVRMVPVLGLKIREAVEPDGAGCKCP